MVSLEHLALMYLYTKGTNHQLFPCIVRSLYAKIPLILCARQKNLFFLQFAEFQNFNCISSSFHPDIEFSLFDTYFNLLVTYITQNEQHSLTCVAIEFVVWCSSILHYNSFRYDWWRPISLK